MKKSVYLDYAAATPVHSDVRRAMEPYFGDKFGNAGSLHSYGQEAMAAIDRAREIVADSLGAKFNEIIFTGSATEANNLALKGVISASLIDNPKIIISEIEHESILETAYELKAKGVQVVRIGVDKKGFVKLKELEEAIDERTVLVSIMYANNEIGTIQPIQEVAKIIRKYKEKNGRGPLLHTDAVQALLFLNCRVDDLHVDLMTLSSHKIYGPKGAGSLYVRGLARTDEIIDHNFKIKPLFAGGGQEFGYRSSTENVPAIVGFGRAIELASKNRERDAKKIAELRDYTWTKIRKIYSKASLNGDFKKRLPNNLNFHIPGANMEEWLIKLDLTGIAVSTGSACAARSLDPSHVISAMGYSKERARNSLRLSFGRYTTTKSHIDKFLKAISD